MDGARREQEKPGGATAEGVSHASKPCPRFASSQKKRRLGEESTLAGIHLRSPEAASSRRPGVSGSCLL